MEQQPMPWWTAVERAHFFSECRTRFHDDFLPVPLDDVSDREAQAIVQRGDLLAALEGVRQAKQVGAIRRAVTL